MRPLALFIVFWLIFLVATQIACERKSPPESRSSFETNVDFRNGFLNFAWGQPLNDFQRTVQEDTLMKMVSVILDSTDRVTCSVTIKSRNFYFLFLDRRLFAVDYFVQRNGKLEITDMIKNLTLSYGNPDSSGDGTLKSLRWQFHNDQKNEIDIFIRETSTTYSVEVLNATIAQLKEEM